MVQLKEFIPILLAIVAIILQVLATPEEVNMQSIVYFGIILSILVVSVVAVTINEKIKKIDKNEEKITKLAELLNYKENIYKLDKRISLLESRMGKKGRIDPQMVIIIVMVVLLILYLRARGIINF